MPHATNEDVPQVSVVIPALNAAGTIAVQLEALAAQQTDRQFEVLVADNGSSDDTRSIVAKYTGQFPSLRLVDASARTGSNVARNEGTRAARGAYILLCDSDDEVAQGWLEALASALDEADAVGGRLDRIKLNSEYIRKWGTPTGQVGITLQLGFLPRPIGANAGFRKNVWETLGGFNERYVRGGTETEFYWRLQLAGYTLVDAPDALVHYRMRADFKSSVRQMYIWGRQSPMLYRDFRSSGMRYDAGETLRRWKSTAALISRSYRGSAARLQTMRHAAYSVGRITGSAKYRVLYI